MSAALELALTIIGVDDSLVHGHGQRGGVAAALSRRCAGRLPRDAGVSAPWGRLRGPGRDRVLASETDEVAAHRALEKESVRVSLTNLRSFDCIREREAAGQLKLRGGWFAVRLGVLELLDEASGEFSPA